MKQLSKPSFLKLSLVFFILINTGCLNQTETSVVDGISMNKRLDQVNNDYLDKLDKLYTKKDKDKKPACTIKGVKTDSGKKIYYLPQHPNYKEQKAQKIFCNTKDAKKSGYKLIVPISS